MLIHGIMYLENKHVVGSNDPDEDLNCYYQMFLDSEMMDEIEENHIQDGGLNSLNFY